MKKNLTLSLILPNVGSSDEWGRTLRSLQPAAQNLQLLTFEDLPELRSLFYADILSGGPPRGFVDMLNRALPHLIGEFVSVLQTGIEIVPALPNLIAEAAYRGGGADYIYGNYFEKTEDSQLNLIEANPRPDDVTEREDWGVLEFYRVSALRNIGGCPAGLRYRPDYDLRLKLTCQKQGVLISEPIGTITKRSEASDLGASSLFFPGRGKFGGFSYLFMDPQEEKEVENIFSAALQRRDAYLAKPPGGRFVPPKKTEPQITVIVPVHNRAGFLPLAIQSVQRGVFQNFEIIIIDNASEDNTLKVAEKLAVADPRIRVVSLSDNVIAKALNTGVNNARGEYIAQLDSDDEYTERTLQAMVEHLDVNLDWALAISYYELMDEQGNTLTDFGIIKHLEYNRNNILRVDGAGAVRVWRKAAIDEFGGYNEEDFGQYGEDYDLVLKVGEKYEVGRVHEVLYRYRRHPGNSDVLRSHAFKLGNKTLARQRALMRRNVINQNQGKLQ
ncbi:MAG: glycosyltransferase family 2 protein [bacterium]|nr:glycosyltransferase family 2 protein [bacterium]